MDKLPDTQELLKTGLNADKPYLGTFSVVEERVRALLSSVNDLRAKQIGGDAVNMDAELERLCSEFQRTFYGSNPEYLGSAWNREDQLGRALVEDAGIGGDTSDAVKRLAAKIISDYLGVYLPYEEDKADDEQFRFGLEGIVEFYTHVLLGLPYEVD